VGLALDHRPAVVAAAPDQIEFVPGVLAEFGCPHSTLVVPGEALRVAMAVRPHNRVIEGVVRRRLARWRHAEDLSGKRGEVLGRSTQAGPASPGIEHAGGAEADPAAVVDSGLRDAGENGMGGSELAAAVFHP